MNTSPPDRIPTEILADPVPAMQDVRDPTAALLDDWIGKAWSQ